MKKQASAENHCATLQIGFYPISVVGAGCGVVGCGVVGWGAVYEKAVDCFVSNHSQNPNSHNSQLLSNLGKT